MSLTPGSRRGPYEVVGSLALRRAQGDPEERDQ
jgi:hypothetical protein